MKILHITDMHFGPYQWFGNSALLLERLNAFNADLIFNTGDMTTDSLEDEFQQTQNFLSQLTCENVISILGNHDKFTRRSHDFFCKYIYDGPFIEPKDKSKIKKRRFYQNQDILTLDGYLYDANFIRSFTINNEKIMIVALDTCVMHQHTGHMEEEVLHAVSDIIETTAHDRIILLTHHPVLSCDDLPLSNSKRITDFIAKHKIEGVFCGHTHEVEILEVKDVINNHRYRSFMGGSLSSRTTARDANMYCTYENFGTKDEIITVTRMYPEGDTIKFVDTVL